jgi:hypothetical protein
MSVFEDRPSPSTPAAVDKVFELARDLTGSLMPEERNDWIVWIAKVRESLRMRGWYDTCHRCSVADVLVQPTFVPVSRGSSELTELLLCAHCRGVQAPMRCSVCGGVGHNRTTCALNLDKIKVVKPTKGGKS